MVANFAQPARHRVFKGGRGSAKTRGLAKMSAVYGYKMAEAGQEGIILSSREHLNSLEESSMEEIKQAIRSEPWLEDYYDIGDKYIRTKNRNISYAFAGLRHNLDSIKSKARILLNWTDEAEPVSHRAWEKLIPTIREEGSENWVSYNPETEFSATHERFIVNKPDNCIVTVMNWRDNPWFPDVLNQERLDDQKYRPETYDHVWEGEFLSLTDAQVFRNWSVKEFEAPSDAHHHFGADWGYAQDPTTLVRCHIVGRQLFIDYEAYEVGCEIVDTPDLFYSVPGAEVWPITADSARPETISHMRAHGFKKIYPAVKGPKSVEDGIEWLKSFEIIVHPRCINTAREMRLYQFKVDKDTGRILPALEDKNNHMIDALRYACEGSRRAAINRGPPPAPAPRMNMPMAGRR